VFYGVGPDSARVDRSNYLLFGASFDAVLQWQITKVFGICGRAGLLAPGLGAGRDADHPDVRTVFDASTAPGLIAVPRFVTTGIAAVADARDHASDPHRGVFFGTALWWFDGISQHEFNFARATADLRGYHTPGSPRGVLAWRALLSADLPSHGAEVPFYLEQTLGGGETLRGFQAYRFRDRAIMAASIEYRWRMNDYLDLGPFVDAGAVAPRVAALALRNLETSAGVRVGLRYKGRVLLHLDWGMCREGQRVTVGVGTMF
jgi:outer membrane protein assembly factor BamA